MEIASTGYQLHSTVHTSPKLRGAACSGANDNGYRSEARVLAQGDFR